MSVSLLRSISGRRRSLWACCRRSSIHHASIDHADRLRHAHVVQSIGVRQARVVEPRALASLPLGPADHAELRHAPARHVVTAFLQLDQRAAIVTSLPSFLLGLLDKLGDLRVLRTVARLVRLVVAERADFELASRASGVFLPFLVLMDMRGLYPFPTFGRRAVDAVLGMVFLVFSVPVSLKFQIKELVHMLEWDVVVCAASRWHMSWVFHRHLEDPLQALVAHAMAACKLGRAWVRDIVGGAGQAFYKTRWWRCGRGFRIRSVATEQCSEQSRFTL